jgi:two-component system OmpR family response regulator
MRAVPRILLVEDDASLRSAVSSSLASEGYAVEALPDGSDLDGRIAAFRPDLAILDVRLPVGPDGFALARRLRQDSEAVPILFLSAATTEDHRLAGFDAGGDDYVVKPFSMAELLARVHALLRRSGRLDSAVIEIGELIVDPGARRVAHGEEELELTPTEYELLVALVTNRGTAVSKERLLALVWGFDDYDSNLVEVHVSALRRKLERHGDRLIHTVRGYGYRAGT